MSALVTYDRTTHERMEIEIETLAQLLQCVRESGIYAPVKVEVFDAGGHRHRFEARYEGETTGLHP